MRLTATSSYQLFKMGEMGDIIDAAGEARAKGAGEIVPLAQRFQTGRLVKLDGHVSREGVLAKILLRRVQRHARRRPRDQACIKRLVNQFIVEDAVLGSLFLTTTVMGM